MDELPEEQAYTVARGCGKNWMIGVARVTIVEPRVLESSPAHGLMK